MYERLQQTTADLARSNRDLQEFASIASHDLQEPLRKIQAFGDRLQELLAGHADEIAIDYLRRMVSAAQRMQSLIKDVLIYSRIAKTDDDGVRALDLRMVVDAALQDLDELIRESRATVEVGELATVTGHPAELQQVFRNVLENALRYRRPDAAPIVRVSRERPNSAPGAIALSNGAETCKITVEDNGTGFDDQFADLIFAPFERLNGRTEQSGNGMGLAIARRILERRGGAIRATSRPGVGSTFTIAIPSDVA
jgi:light-regulated signal transduction histidine kinase (bacteriophytochrome)